MAVGGGNAGLLFQGDRRFDIVVRLPDAMREIRRHRTHPNPVAGTQRCGHTRLCPAW